MSIENILNDLLAKIEEIKQIKPNNINNDLAVVDHYGYEWPVRAEAIQTALMKLVAKAEVMQRLKVISETTGETKFWIGTPFRSPIEVRGYILDGDFYDLSISPYPIIHKDSPIMRYDPTKSVSYVACKDKKVLLQWVLRTLANWSHCETDNGEILAYISNFEQELHKLEAKAKKSVRKKIPFVGNSSGGWEETYGNTVDSLTRSSIRLSTVRNSDAVFISYDGYAFNTQGGQGTTATNTGVTTTTAPARFATDLGPTIDL